MRKTSENEGRSVGQPAQRQWARVLALVAALGLVAGGLVGSAAGTSAATSGPISLSPQTAEIAPGSYVDVTVTNTSRKNSTSALSSSVSVSSPNFQVTNGCLGVALGKGKSCTVRIAYTATTAPSTDQTATLTVASKKPGVVDTETGTYTVKTPTGCAQNTTVGSFASNDLQAVINAAAADDTIQVTGTCTGNFSIDKNLTLTGVSGTSATLDGNAAGRVLAIQAGAVTVSGLTITNGLLSNFQNGGGVRIRDFATLTLDRVTVTGNTTNGEGGGIGNLGLLTVTGSTISNNTAGKGGGISQGCGPGATTVIATTISNNTSSDSGGGVDACVPVTLKDATITGNTAVGPGGGVYTVSDLLLKGTTSVTGNTAGAYSRGGVVVFFGVLTACDNTGVDSWIGSLSPNSPEGATPVNYITCS